jgi:predicted amidohydrolase YtcJ
MIRAALLVAFTLFLAGPAVGQSSVTVLHNAQIYTVDPAQPTAEAMAFADGRILMVATSEAVLSAYPGADLVDAGGRTVVPGLIDAHGHLMGLGQSLVTANLVSTRSIGEAIERLQAFAADLPEGAWLVGRGWDQNEWVEQRFPTAADLDAAFPDRPVWLVRVDGHAAWANTAAMLHGPGLADRADPEGGRIARDASGQPTGLFIDTAMGFVQQAIPQPSAEDHARMLALALGETARYGLTGLHDAGVDLASVRLFQQAIDAGRFPLRLYAMIGGPGETLDHFCADGLIEDHGGRLAVRSLKLYTDGALGSRGAALIEDYEDDPGNRGLLMFSPADFASVVERAMGCGLQVNTHAIGDRGARLVLDTYEAMLRHGFDNPGRHRMEHAQVVALEDLPRFSELGVIASVQPIHATSDMGWAEDRVGPDRIRGAYAWRSLLDAGARLALGSDFPVEPVNPILGFHAAITRQDASGRPPGGWYPEERLTREEALRGFTLDAAYAAFMEDEVGSLAAGKRADFVILARNIMVIPPEDVLGTAVVTTYLDGEPVYQRAD